jgi:hypothetical protein
MIFKVLMVPRKSKCDVLSDTAQGWACPIIIFTKLMLCYIIFKIINISLFILKDLDGYIYNIHWYNKATILF